MNGSRMCHEGSTDQLIDINMSEKGEENAGETSTLLSKASESDKAGVDSVTDERIIVAEEEEEEDEETEEERKCVDTIVRDLVGDDIANVVLPLAAGKLTGDLMEMVEIGSKDSITEAVITPPVRSSSLREPPAASKQNNDTKKGSDDPTQGAATAAAAAAQNGKTTCVFNFDIPPPCADDERDDNAPPEIGEQMPLLPENNHMYRVLGNGQSDNHGMHALHMYPPGEQQEGPDGDSGSEYPPTSDAAEAQSDLGQAPVTSSHNGTSQAQELSKSAKTTSHTVPQQSPPEDHYTVLPQGTKASPPAVTPCVPSESPPTPLSEASRSDIQVGQHHVPPGHDNGKAFQHYTTTTAPVQAPQQYYSTTRNDRVPFDMHHYHIATACPVASQQYAPEAGAPKAHQHYQRQVGPNHGQYYPHDIEQSQVPQHYARASSIPPGHQHYGRVQRHPQEHAFYTRGPPAQDDQTGVPVKSEHIYEVIRHPRPMTCIPPEMYQQQGSIQDPGEFAKPDRPMSIPAEYSERAQSASSADAYSRGQVIEQGPVLQAPSHIQRPHHPFPQASQQQQRHMVQEYYYQAPHECRIPDCTYASQTLPQQQRSQHPPPPPQGSGLYEYVSPPEEGPGIRVYRAIRPGYSEYHAIPSSSTAFTPINHATYGTAAVSSTLPRHGPPPMRPQPTVACRSHVPSERSRDHSQSYAPHEPMYATVNKPRQQIQPYVEHDLNDYVHYQTLPIPRHQVAPSAPPALTVQDGVPVDSSHLPSDSGTPPPYLLQLSPSPRAKSPYHAPPPRPLSTFKPLEARQSQDSLDLLDEDEVLVQSCEVCRSSKESVPPAEHELPPPPPPPPPPPEVHDYHEDSDDGLPRPHDIVERRHSEPATTVERRSSDAIPIDPRLYQSTVDVGKPEKWKILYDKYDTHGRGEISLDDFRGMLDDPEFREDFDDAKLVALEQLTMEDERTVVKYQELLTICRYKVSTKRRQSFKLAVHSRDRDNGVTLPDGNHEGLGEDVTSPTTSLPLSPRCIWGKMVRHVAKEFLVDERDRQYFADHYTCWPPPLFIPTVTLVEIGFFVYYAVEAGDISPSGPVPVNSIFIYRPDKRIEIWRFFFYMLIHAGWVHLFFNMLVQLLVGVPLEMVHGSFRIGTVYMAGVLAGSLGTSVFDMDAFLVGASGGVYALLAAHLANILLNYSEMELGVLKLAAVFIIASIDVGFAIWDRYTNSGLGPPVGYVSHLMGALAGLTIGLLVLKNFEQKLHVQVMWWVALGIYSACMLFAILWNIFYY